MEFPGNLVRLCISTGDKDVYDVVVHEDDSIWNLKVKLFELLNVFPTKQSLSVKDEVISLILSHLSLFIVAIGKHTAK